MEKHNYYYDILIDQLMGMFDYKNVGVRNEVIENTLITQGIVACGLFKNELIFGSPIIEQYDFYKFPKYGSNCTIITINGFEFSGLVGIDIVFGYNNRIGKADSDIVKYAEFFNEIDKSILINVLNSRLTLIPTVKDEKDRQTVKEILKNIYNGKSDVIVSKNIITDYLQNKKCDIDTIELTRPEEIERVQYLSKLYDDMLSRFWSMYGHPMNFTGKMAQLTKEELKGYDTFSRIKPLNMLSERQKFCKTINNTFGLDVSVDFSEAFKHIRESEENEK